MTAADTLHALVDDPGDDCIVWPLARKNDQYGVLRYEGRTRRAHVVSCENAHGPRPDGKEVAHSCGNRPCINPKHLRWATRKENMGDNIRMGRTSRGRGGKLTERDVKQIRDLRCRGLYQREVAELFGISQPTVSEIELGKIWGWL